VFVADLLGRVDGQCSPSGFVLALSAVPAGKLAARGKKLSAAGQQSDLLL